MMALDGLVIFRRAALPLILAIGVIASSAYYFVAADQLLRLALDAKAGLIALVPNRVPEHGPPLHLAAISADPVDQAVVNEVIAARAFRTGDKARALSDAALLRRLGWHSTTALQNLLWRAVTTRDIPLTMDTLEALLRRQVLLDRIHPILNRLTTNAEFRSLLIDRLSARPSWREYYLRSAANLQDPAEIDGLYRVMRGIQSRGDRLKRNEVAPILPRLIASGRTAEAYELWRAHNAAPPTSPLADANFSLASEPVAADALPVPFEWQFGSGTGYFATAAKDGQGSYLSIDWDGRGVPVFATQLSSARAGRYQLNVVGDSSSSDLAAKLGYRFVCPNGATADFTLEGKPTSHELRYESGLVGCDFPTLQLFGLVQPATSATPIIVRRLTLKKLG